jgi:hypothetical protein
MFPRKNAKLFNLYVISGVARYSDHGSKVVSESTPGVHVTVEISLGLDKKLPSSALLCLSYVNKFDWGFAKLNTSPIPLSTKAAVWTCSAEADEEAYVSSPVFVVASLSTPDWR